AGYRHVDTAAAYQNEEGVGRALADSAVPREEVFVTTKLWNSEQGSDRTPRAFDASMQRLGLDVLDLYLVHWPAPGRDRYVEAWRAMQELRDAGRVRAIGVCNFQVPHLARLREETGELPAVNQVELHPYLQQAELRAWHAENGVVTESWSPLASGKEVLDDPVVGRIARAHGVTPAQIVIAWHLALDCVVIPKSVTPSRIRENLAAADVALSDDDLAALAGLDRGFRTGPDPDDFDLG
ncbi:MAG: aldo/keto reductase, partial [Phycicoccus sp.]